MTTSAASTRLHKLGEYLPCSETDIDWALSVQTMESANGNVRRLGQILVEREQLSQENLVDALVWQLFDRLRLCSLLADLDDSELAAIAEKAQEIRLEPGEMLFHEGQRGDSAYVVLKGRLLLSCSDRESEHPVGVVLPGDAIGETEFLTGGTHLRSAYATEPTTLLKILYELVPNHERCIDDTTWPHGFPAAGTPAEVIEAIEHRACKTLRAHRAYVFVRDPVTGSLTAKRGDFEVTIPAGTNLLGWVAQWQETINLREAYLDPRFDAEIDIRMGYWTRSLLAAPVIGSDGRVVAVIEVLNKQGDHFTADDEALLHALTYECAAALEFGTPARFR